MLDEDRSQWNGVLPLDKPSGMTSARVVSRVKALLPRGLKVGHAGTLDPFATGLLLVLIGKATKQCEPLMGATKTYQATIKFGAVTATDDCDSPEQRFEASPDAVDAGQPPAAVPQPPAVAAAVAQFVGTIQQAPPVYSALKLGGRRACDRVRAGETITLAPRTVRIDRITLDSFAWPLADITVVCGRGTYIRALARDIGAALGVGGYLSALRRTRVGVFSVNDACRVDELTVEAIRQLFRIG